MCHPASRHLDINFPGRVQDAMLRCTSTVVVELCREGTLCSSYLQVARRGLQLDKQLWPPAGLRVVNMIFWAICLPSRFWSRCAACDQ